ncbi:MAG: hypothetical protein HUK40_03665 [Desulfobacter sp.]|nr:hypothetical protein [Desulfobacter sp.]
MNMIHADPNPGNFLVMDNLDIGLVDFGCVRAVSPGFVAQYQELIRIGGSKNKEAYHALMVRMKMISPDLNSKILNQVISLFMDVGEWINQLFRHEYFDFKDHPGFMAQGRNMGRHIQKIRRHIQGFPP